MRGVRSPVVALRARAARLAAEDDAAAAELVERGVSCPRCHHTTEAIGYWNDGASTTEGVCGAEKVSLRTGVGCDCRHLFHGH